MRRNAPRFPIGLALVVFITACASSADDATAASAPEGGGGGQSAGGGGAFSGGAGTSGSAAGGKGGSSGGGAGAAGSGVGGAGGAGSADITAACRGCLEIECAEQVSTCKGQASCAPCLESGGTCGSSAVDAALKACACGQCKEQCSGAARFGCTQGSAGAAGGAGAGGVGAGGASGASAGGTSAAGAAGQNGGQGGSAGSAGSGGSADQEDCTDGLDNDLNDKIDCDDEECTASCADACNSSPVLLVGTPRKGTTKGHKNQFSATCILADETGPDVAFRITAPGTGLLRLKLDAAVDMALSVRSSCAPGLADLACSDQLSGGGTEQVALSVTAGEEVYALVGGVGAGVEGDFTLTAELEPIACGDGKLSPTEQCDDGNLDDADACTSACLLQVCLTTPTLDGVETEAGAEVNDTTAAVEAAKLHPSCAKLGDPAPARVYQLRATHGGRVEARLEPLDGADLGLSVRSSCQEGSSENSCVDSAGPGGVERLSVAVVAGQSLFLVVGGYDSAQAGAFKLRVRNAELVCGDGKRSSAEQCDPEQAGQPHKCTEGCVLEVPGGNTEAEPNDTPSTGQAYAVGGVLGAILPAKDADVYRIEIASDGAKLVAEVDDRLDSGDAYGACAAEQLDSFVELLAPDGETVLASDDDGGDGFCSKLEASGLAAGSYFLRVRASPTYARESVFSYRLVATVQ
jgi:cysteine-rich repeat protein